MGNHLDTRAHFDAGYLYVKTDRTFYYRGDVVYGKVYIRALREIKARHLIIDVKAKEKASHWDLVDNGQETYWEKIMFMEKYFEFK